MDYLTTAHKLEAALKNNIDFGEDEALHRFIGTEDLEEVEEAVGTAVESDLEAIEEETDKDGETEK